ncbi:hypothetical protein GINT2_000909 [Glugoides intestinalis]
MSGEDLLKIVKTFKDIVTHYPTFLVSTESCPYCNIARNTFLERKVDFKEIKQKDYPGIADIIKKDKKYKSFPMIAVDGVFIGGSDNLQEYYANLDENKENASTKDGL